MQDDKDAIAELKERLASQGLNLPAGDLEGLKAAILEIEAGSVALRRDRPFALEPAFALRLAKAEKNA
ncbi:MAG TPA: hypothetical protein VGU72_25225 [Beijerinckiaceae bacterium]|jgi:hypothetical protein|nr:hypothetical protein [Beijerinckiaceae bacterium]